jgi:hypothetical protein
MPDLMSFLGAQPAPTPAPVATPTLPPALQQWVDAHPPEQREQATAAAQEHLRANPSLAVEVVQANPTPAPPVAMPAAPGPVIETTVVETTPAQPIVTVDLAKVDPQPKTEPASPKRGRGRPAKGAAQTLLEACAAGGQTPDAAREYLALLESNS